MIEKYGGQRKNSGRMRLSDKRFLLSVRCNDKDWKIIKSWNEGDASKRANDILKIMRRK